MIRTDGGGVVDSIKALAGAAAEGDRSAVEHEFAINCRSFFESLR